MLITLLGCLAAPVKVTDKITVHGGLGDDQTLDIQNILKDSLRSLIVGHSLGAKGAITEASARGLPVLLLDPVTEDGDDLWLPETVPYCIILYRDEVLGPRRARVWGFNIRSVTLSGTTHNSLPHDPRVLALIKKF